jgi:hypothetical protein
MLSSVEKIGTKNRLLGDDFYQHVVQIRESEKGLFDSLWSFLNLYLYIFRKCCKAYDLYLNFIFPIMLYIRIMYLIVIYITFLL